MKSESRIVIYDEQLKIEAYILQGIVQPFPNHFHDFYVIGLMDQGKRYLNCKNIDYELKKDDMIIFNPNDNHGCTQLGDELLTYYGLNIPTPILLSLVEEITGEKSLPIFFTNVIQDPDAISIYRPLHKMIMEGNSEFEKEEGLFLLISHLLQHYNQSFTIPTANCEIEIENACRYIEENYNHRLSLDEICKTVSLSKSSLLRGFTKSKGVTPYRYLETIRIGKARKFLEEGLLPIDVAQLAGFSDQSHFTNYFSQFIGLSPGTYRDIFHHEDLSDE